MTGVVHYDILNPEEMGINKLYWQQAKFAGGELRQKQATLMTGNNVTLQNEYVTPQIEKKEGV